MKKRLPFQPLPKDRPVTVWAIPYPEDPLSFRHHRHQFCMLLWVTAGHGIHEVNFSRQELTPGQVLFVQEGQSHRIIQQPESGWVILFHPDIFRRFLRYHPLEEQHGLFDQLSTQPIANLDDQGLLTYQNIMPLLTAQIQTDPSDSIADDHLAILLQTANRQHRAGHPALLHPQQAEQMRQLKMLIEKHYLSQRNAPFYAEKLSIVPRKLNRLSSKLTGLTVSELVEARIISAAETLLGSTLLTIKEISFQLGFADQSHFAYFFRRRKKISPSRFRERVCKGF